VDDGALQDEDGEYLDVLALEETVRGGGCRGGRAGACCSILRRDVPRCGWVCAV